MSSYVVGRRAAPTNRPWSGPCRGRRSRWARASSTSRLQRGPVEVVAGGQPGLEDQDGAGRLGEQVPSSSIRTWLVDRTRVDADVGAARVDEDLLVLLEPVVERVPADPDVVRQVGVLGAAAASARGRPAAPGRHRRRARRTAGSTGSPRGRGRGPVSTTQRPPPCRARTRRGTGSHVALRGDRRRVVGHAVTVPPDALDRYGRRRLPGWALDERPDTLAQHDRDPAHSPHHPRDAVAGHFPPWRRPRPGRDLPRRPVSDAVDAAPPTGGPGSDPIWPRSSAPRSRTAVPS